MLDEMYRRLPRHVISPLSSFPSPRHTSAAIALDSGTSLDSLQDRMCHADLRTTRRYDRVRNNLLKSAGYDAARALA